MQAFAAFVSLLAGVISCFFWGFLAHNAHLRWPWMPGTYTCGTIAVASAMVGALLAVWFTRKPRFEVTL